MTTYGRDSTSEQPERPGSDAEQQVRERATAVSEQAQEMGARTADAARDAAESGREGAAGMLERTAERIEQRSDEGGMQGAAAGKAAEGMQAAAGYLKEHDTGELIEDVEHYVRSHPMRSLAGAVAAGFLVGRILR